MIYVGLMAQLAKRAAASRYAYHSHVFSWLLNMQLAWYSNVCKRLSFKGARANSGVPGGGESVGLHRPL